jgi:hypothetical protein
MGFVFAGLALALITPAAAAPAPVPPAISAPSAVLDQARRLDELMSPHAVLVDMNLAGLKATALRTMALDPAMVKLEAAYPGISRASLEASLPVARAFCEDYVDRVSRYKVNLFAQRLTSAELAEIIDFYGSPAGRRVVQRTIGNADIGSLADMIAHQAAETGKPNITADQVAQLERTNELKTMQQISVQDQVALMRFAQTPAGKKFSDLSGEAQVHILEIANNPNPEQLGKLKDAMRVAVLAFVDHARAK